MECMIEHTLTAEQEVDVAPPPSIVVKALGAVPKPGSVVNCGFQNCPNKQFF